MSESRSGGNATLTAVLVGLAALLLVIIALQNTAVVTINLFFWSLGMSLILLIVIVALLGFIAGLLTQALIKRRKD